MPALKPKMELFVSLFGLEKREELPVVTPPKREDPFVLAVLLNRDDEDVLLNRDDAAGFGAV